MTTSISNPDPHVLIPPLLAILPTSFASSRPPPALLPLLSPILQQRLNIHTSSAGSEHDSWLRFLTWDSSKAESLKEQIENANFEPHPSSGEIEVGDVEAVKYKRFDAETLKARIVLSEWDLTVVYLWCTGGETGDSWRLAELMPFNSDLLEDSTWHTSIEAAESAVRRHEANAQPSWLQRKISVQGEDDDYWAMYDRTPDRTPARQGSVNPAGAGASDDDYYARYGSVQPALDGHDPDEAHEEVGQSSLTGNALQEMLARRTADDNANPADHATQSRGERSAEDEDVVHVSHPVPSSPSSRAGSDAVARLEENAERYTASEIAIRQHISTSIKSMYRLAKAAGMNRDEFDDMVQRELETLSIFDAND